MSRKQLYPILVVSGLGIIGILVNHFINLNKSSLPKTNFTAPKQLTLTEFLSKGKLPVEDKTVKRTVKKVGGYTLSTADISTVSGAIGFHTGNVGIGFTPVGNPILGEPNTSTSTTPSPLRGEGRGEGGNNNLTMEPSSAKALEGQAINNKVVYPNIYNGINLIYTATKDKLLEEYEVRSKSSVQITEFVQKIDLTNVTYEKQKDGSIIFYKNTQNTTEQNTEQHGKQVPSGSVSGSVPFRADKEFAFALPRPVMYEKYNSRERNYSLHYEIFTQCHPDSSLRHPELVSGSSDGSKTTGSRNEFGMMGGKECNGTPITYLVKVIDPQGQLWLREQANYPVMIDGTIVLTLFGYESYPVIDDMWKIRLDTVGEGNLSISPANNTTLCHPDSSVIPAEAGIQKDGSPIRSGMTNSDTQNDICDMQIESITCGNNSLPFHIENNNITLSDFSCNDLALVSSRITNSDKQVALQFNYGTQDDGKPYSTIVKSPVYEGKPLFLSSIVNPPVVSVGQTLTITTEVMDQNGISKVTADIGGLEKIELQKMSGTDNQAVYSGKWTANGTKLKQYAITLTALNTKGSTEQSLITFYDPPDCRQGGDWQGADFNPATDCTSPAGIFAGTHTNIGTFSIGENQYATISAHDNWVNPQYGFATISATTVTIAGLLDGNAKGYDEAGPGGGTDGVSMYNGGGGGGYGGGGADGSRGIGGPQYGSPLNPTDLGSGGGDYFNHAYQAGIGGGAIKITVSGTLTVNGTIRSNGGDGQTGSGGGSGGSIHLTADAVSGTGSVTANGGNGNATYTGGGGGGGRILINYSTSFTPSNLTALTAANGTTGTGAEVGSIVIMDTANDDLYIYSSQTWDANPTQEGSTHTYRYVFVQNNSTWTLNGYYTNNTDGVGFTFNVTDFSISTGSAVSANGGGYAGGGSPTENGSGPGGGAGNVYNGAGGGYGGEGADGGGSGGTTYGSIALPVDLGSGGGGDLDSGFFDGTSTGGSGGGAIIINASGTVDVDGTISANGNTGGAEDGGGGSGGSIKIISSFFNGASTGTITADGGNGASGSFGEGAGGGGGRIAIYYRTSEDWSANNAGELTTANATTVGTGGTGGQNGTVIFSKILVWDGGGEDGTCGGSAGDGNKWSCALNWSGNATPLATESAQFDTTSTKNATIDSSFQGTISTLFINTGYSGTITQSRSFAATYSIVQTDGVFDITNQTTTVDSIEITGGSFNGNNGTLDINGSYLITGGSFTAPSASGSMTVAGHFTITSGTFTHNSGTITFDGSISSTLACNSVVSFSTVIITKSPNTTAVTVGSNCTLPLGAGPTVTAALTNYGTLSGTGTLTLTSASTSTHTFGVGGSLSGFSGLTSTGIFTVAGGTVNLSSATSATFNQAFNISGGSFTAPASPNTATFTGAFTQSGGTFNGNSGTLDMNSTYALNGGTFTSTSGILYTASTFTVTNGVFNHNSGTVTFDGTPDPTVTCNSIIFNQVNISKAASTDTIAFTNTCSLPLGNNPSSTGTITNNGIITVGSGTWTISGAYTHSAGATLSMSGTGLSISGTLTINQSSIFPSNINLTSTGSSSSVTCTQPTTFQSLTLSKTAGQTLTFGAGCTVTISGSNPTFTGSLTNNGTITLSHTGTLGLEAYTQSAGSVLNGSSTNVSMTGSLTVNGGTFPSNLNLTLTSTGNQTITGNPITFNSLEVSKTNGTTYLSGNITTGNFTRTDGIVTINTSNTPTTLNITGNLSLSTTDSFGNAGVFVKLTGTGNQTIENNGPATFSSPFTVNKSSGTATLINTALTVSSSPCTVENGTFDTNGYNFSCATEFKVKKNGILTLVGSEAITTPTLENGSTVTYKGDGDSNADSYYLQHLNYSNLTVNFTDSNDALTSTPSGTISNLTGYWNMNEASWTNDCSANTVLDSSGNSYHGQACPASTGPTGGATGKFNNGGSFDGNNDYVKAYGVVASLTNSSFSFGGWANPTDVTRGTIASFHTSTGGNLNTIFWAQDGANAKFYYYDDGVSYIASTSTFSTGQWHYVMVTIDSSNNGVMYVDNKVEAVFTTAVRPATNGRFSIGQEWDSSTPSDFFKGSIDEVRVYNKSLNSGEVMSLFYQGSEVPYAINNNLTITQGIFSAPPTLTVSGNFTNNGTFNDSNGTVVFANRISSSTNPTTGNLQGYWKMDNLNAQLTDSSGNAITGVPTGTTIVDGKNNKARSFNGSSDFINLGSPSQLNYERTNAFSMSIWAKTTSATGSNIIARQNSTANVWQGIGLYYCGSSASNCSPGSVRLDLNNDWGSNYLINYGSSRIDDGNWHHFVATYDGSSTAAGVKLYVDNVSQTNTTAGTLSSSIIPAVNWRIGAYEGGNYFNGSIDEVRIYNDVLTSSEVTNLYYQFPPEGATTNYSIIGGTSATTFHNLTSTARGKTLFFESGDTFTIENGGVLTLSGVILNSTNKSTQWNINQQGTESVTNTYITNSGCDGSSADITVTTSTDGGNVDTCWLFPSKVLNSARGPTFQGSVEFRGGVIFEP